MRVADSGPFPVAVRSNLLLWQMGRRDTSTQYSRQPRSPSRFFEIVRTLRGAITHHVHFPTHKRRASPRRVPVAAGLVPWERCRTRRPALLPRRGSPREPGGNWKAVDRLTLPLFLSTRPQGGEVDCIKFKLLSGQPNQATWASHLSSLIRRPSSRTHGASAQPHCTPHCTIASLQRLAEGRHQQDRTADPLNHTHDCLLSHFISISQSCTHHTGISPAPRVLALNQYYYCDRRPRYPDFPRRGAR